jgi:hypothetical protein
MNRTTLISLIVLAVFALGGTVYFLFFTGGTPSVTVAPDGGSSLPVAGQIPTPTGSGATGSGGSPDGTNAVPNTPVSVTSRLVQISQGPVVPGEVVVDIKSANASSSPTVAVNYIERESGNVFTFSPATKILTRINNKTLPGIQSASWLPDGSAAFVRYLSGTDFSTVNTYALSATSSSGFFLPQDLSDIAVSSTSVLTLASGVNGSIASLSRTDGTKPITLFSSPLSALRVSFAGKNQYLAFSKPSASLSGDAFLVSALGRFSRIAGPLDGLIALASPGGKWVLVSYVLSGAMQTELINLVTNASITLPLATIADKCVWANDDLSIYCGVPVNPGSSYSYPDDWYQGAVQFSDRIWKIDVTGRYAQLVLDFSQANKGTLDAVSLAINPSLTTLVFVNKNDGSLWSYSL